MTLLKSLRIAVMYTDLNTIFVVQNNLGHSQITSC